MKYFFIAGERSGDQHGSRLIREIGAIDSEAVFVGIGGDAMREEGMELLVHYRSMSYMGVAEIIKHLPDVLGNFRQAKRLLVEHKPDVLVLIDFAAFNLKIAKYAQGLELKVCYYIAPKVWAWNEKRIRKIRRYVHKLLCILPFEEQYFRDRGCEAIYVGNPVMEQVKSHTHSPLTDLPNEEDTRIIAFLPGSRSHEVHRSKAVIRQLAMARPSWIFLVAGVRNLSSEDYQEIERLPNIRLHFDRTYDLLQSSDAAVVTSGTATLETALLRVPQVVGYRTSRLTYEVGRRLVKVPYISLVNLIAGESIVKELLQEDFALNEVLTELEKIATLGPGKDKDIMLAGYQRVSEILGGKSASKTGASEIVTLAHSGN